MSGKHASYGLGHGELAVGPGTAGSLFAAGCVLLWAQAGCVFGLYLAFAGIGLAGAAVLYEPAFATVNAYFDVQRRNALLTPTAAAALRAVPGSYTPVFRAVAGCSLSAALLLLAADQAHR